MRKTLFYYLIISSQNNNYRISFMLEKNIDRSLVTHAIHDYKGISAAKNL